MTLAAHKIFLGGEVVDAENCTGKAYRKVGLGELYLTGDFYRSV